MATVVAKDRAEQICFGQLAPACSCRIKQGFGREGYTIRINGRIEIEASAQTGLFYGLVTLRQLGELHGGKWIFPKVIIKDSPRYGYRGLMLDSARHFWSVAEVESVIDSMAKLKLNRFHWHLTDDQAWRLTLPTSVTEEPANPLTPWPPLPQVGEEERNAASTRTGQFYISADIAEITAYAKDRHIVVIPEIDLPGHSMALQKAFPSLACGISQGKQGLHMPPLCIGDPEKQRLLQNIIQHSVNILPNEIVHIGGDEVDASRWQGCPKCKAVGEEPLHKFLQSVAGWLPGRAAVWDEGWSKRMPLSTICYSWHGRGPGREAINAGYDAIMCPAEFCYLDKSEQELPLAKVYGLEPEPPHTQPAQRKHLIGAEWCLWTEKIESLCQLNKQLFPRLFAAAEVAWSAHKDFKKFKARLIQRTDIGDPVMQR